MGGGVKIGEHRLNLIVSPTLSVTTQKSYPEIKRVLWPTKIG